MATADVTRPLDEAGVAYELLPHAHTETAAAEARALGLARSAVAKTLVLRTPSGYVRVVIAASDRLDIRKVRESVGGGQRVHLASEDDLARFYPEFELGAVPPFGGARRERVLIDRRVAERDWLVLEAGSHDESIRLNTADLVRLTQAEVADFCKE